MARKIISCSACGARFDVSKYPPGSRVRCGRCNQVLTVPAEDGPVVAPLAAPVAAPQPQSTASRGAPPQSAPPRTIQPAPATRTGLSGPPPAAALGTPAAAPSADSDPLIGRAVNGQYRIVRKLGEGGYGAVYEAKDVNLERRVAIKIMLQARAQSREYVAKFLREARTAAQLSHPNVVAVHGVGFDRDLGVHFLAMEYVEGRTIHDILQERGPLPVDEACNWLVQSCRGLQAAHDRNIIHRDIKPGNLMITPGGAIKITDFGLAKIYDAEAAQSTVIGTPYFMPPEQFEGKAKDGRTDIYALGVTFYYMLTMQRPHTGAGPAQILLSVMTKEPPSILEYRPDLPEGLWPIVRRMILRDLDKRYATCAEIVADVERLQGHGEEEVEQLYCPACGVPNGLDASTCSGCGESLQETCPVCSATDAAGTKFCGDCGANIPLERAVLALIQEGQALLGVGRLTRAREKLQQAQERSPQNMKVAQLIRDLEVRCEQRDQHRDAVRELLAHGRPQEALERWKLAKADFPESSLIGELETDVQSALAAREAAGTASADALANARRHESEGRVREALVAWRGVLVLFPGNDEALQGESRARETVERADALAADGVAAIQQGDPETARDLLSEAARILVGDPVIDGRLREADRACEELKTELAAAEAALAKGPSDAAVERLRILCARNPGSRRARTALDHAENAGRAATAGAARDRVQRALTAARRHTTARHLRDAATAFREAASLDPDCTEATEGLAMAQRGIAESEALLGQSRSLVSVGDPEGALAAAEQAIAILADDPAVAAQFARARTTLETMQHEADRIRASLGADADEDVLTWARELAGQFPGSTLAADVLRETEKACREADEKASESRAKTLLARAAKLEDERQFERAAKAYEDAVRLAPGNLKAKASLDALRERLTSAAAKTDDAQTRLDAGDPDAARTLAEEALRLLPDQVRAAGVLAGARTAVAEIDRAAESFDGGANVDADRAESQLDRVRRLMAKYPGSKRCADLEARAATVLETARATARRRRIASRISEAERALSEGRLGDAERSCLDAQSIEPADSLVAALLEKVTSRRARAAQLVEDARAASDAGRHADALDALEEALNADPESAAAAAGRDAAAAAVEKARDALRKALGEAVQADRAGRRAEALDAWQRVLAIDPTNSKAGAEIDRLRTWIVSADRALAAIAEKIADGDPDAALAAAQDARTRLGAWDKMDDELRRARALVEEVDRGTRAIERDVASVEGELTAVADAARALATRFPRSAKARDTAARAAAAAEERRRALAVSQVRKLVRDHRYEEAVRLASDLRSQGVASNDLDAAEMQARRVIDEVTSLRAQAAAKRTAGDLDGALAALRQVQVVLPDDPGAKQDVHEADETIREFTARLDTAETTKRRGDLTRSLDACREALALNPGDAALRQRMAEVETLRTQRAALVRACESAIRGGDGDACTKSAKDLLALFPDDDDARDLQTTGDSMRTIVQSLLAHAKRQSDLGETDSATVTLECVLRIAPDHAEARSLLGR
ncbi:MAG: protein kinase [Planctomycetes bacterium]|nr:protein kinase [Planctomycetota bacterium]